MTREEAIKDIQENIKPFVGGKSLDMAIEALEAEPIKHAHWVHDKDDVIISGYCSVCGWASCICETDVAGMPFCPNCGATMDGEEK